jgi:hypothetical protein
MQFKRCVLLTSAVLLPAAARGDVLSDWNKAVTDTIVANKINSNVRPPRAGPPRSIDLV